jgi:hypothetical protein
MRLSKKRREQFKRGFTIVLALLLSAGLLLSTLAWYF